MSLRIRDKLVILTLLPVFVACSLTLFAVFQLQGLTSASMVLIKDRMEPMITLKKLSDVYSKNVIDLSHKSKSQMIFWKEAEKGIDEAISYTEFFWDDYLSRSLTQNEKEIIENGKSARDEASKAMEKLKALIKDHSAYSLGNFIDLELYPSIDPVLSQIDALFAEQVRLAAQAQVLSKEQAEESIRSMIWILAIFAAVSAALGAWIIRSILIPLRSVKAAPGP